MRKNIKLKFLLVFIALLFLFIPYVVEAAEICRCWNEITNLAETKRCDPDCSKCGDYYINCNKIFDAEEVEEQHRALETLKSVVPKTGTQEPFVPVVRVKIGQTEVKFTGVACDGEKCSIDWIAKYISIVYQYGVGIAAILAVVMIMVGGFIWLASAGSPDKITKAKEFIISAITGLLLALFSFIILTSINPGLVRFQPLSISQDRLPDYEIPGWASSGGGAAGQSDPCGGSGIVTGNDGSQYDMSRYATFCGHVPALNRHLQDIGPINDATQAQAYIDRRFPGSPITGEMVMNTAEKYNVDPALVLAAMAQDSSMGTRGRGADSNNPGNVANADTPAHTEAGCKPPGELCTSSRGTLNCCYPTWQDGVDAVGRWLGRNKI